ncbi:hypothetical protein [Cellvibrio sp. OA-2007]|uniref:hypothetical protein n=1 Tax=Cellvibrio sp. OA-2007 TaxID=529823 RepID=UPI0007850B46|nr:hypothetical protein [Cellvibrio sp. OA-2007]
MEHFDDFLTAARAQADAQRLLLVFVAVDEVANNNTQEGGFLTPKMCVDKTPNEITSFNDLIAEAAQTGQVWSLVFAASLAGKGADAPSSSDANKPLDAMIAGINTGMIQQYLVFDKQGDILSLTANE